jgi:hypothetical protein
MKKGEVAEVKDIFSHSPEAGEYQIKVLANSVPDKSPLLDDHCLPFSSHGRKNISLFLFF